MCVNTTSRSSINLIRFGAIKVKHSELKIPLSQLKIVVPIGSVSFSVLLEIYDCKF